MPNPYLDYLTDASFQGVNRLFVLSFENTAGRTVQTKYYLPAVKMRITMLWLTGKIFLMSQQKMIQEHMITFEKLWLIKEMVAWLDFNYFNKYYKMIAIDLSKQQALDADPKAIQQINFTGNLNWARYVNENTMILIIEEAKETILDFSQGTVKVLWIYFTSI